jgi:hypothetical protein
MKSLLMALACLSLLSIPLFVTGCNDAQAALGGMSPPPKPCTIQFRRDALGAAASLPISPLTDSLNGGETSISGTLKMVNDDWVVLDRGGKDIWVSRSVVLLIKYQ